MDQDLRPRRPRLGLFYKLWQPREDQFQAPLHRRVLANTLVQSAHFGPLIIIEQGDIVGAWDVGLSIFSR